VPGQRQYKDDVLYSLLLHLRETEFIVKDLTGVAEEARGTLDVLFPDIVTEDNIIALDTTPQSQIKLPAIGVGVEMNEIPTTAFFGGGGTYRHTGRIVVIATASDEQENRLTVETIQQAVQLENALSNHFGGKDEKGNASPAAVDWYRHTYDSAGTDVLVGEILIRNWQVYKISDCRFAGGFEIELCS
jgi:hypothetical protein